MLEPAGRVGFGVDVRDLLELERAFKCDRIVHTAAEEQRMVLCREALRPGGDLRLELQHIQQGRGQMTQRSQITLLALAIQAATQFAEHERKQIERGELRSER